MGETFDIVLHDARTDQTLHYRAERREAIAALKLEAENDAVTVQVKDRVQQIYQRLTADGKNIEGYPVTESPYLDEPEIEDVLQL